MRDLIFQIKHSMSCLADKKFRVLIDDEKMIVTVIANVFDSSLIGWILMKALPEEHEVVAFSDDNSGLIPKHPPYSLRIRIGGDDGQEFDAEAVRLSSVVWGGLQVSITLAPIKTADVRRDMDATELKGNAERQTPSKGKLVDSTVPFQTNHAAGLVRAMSANDIEAAQAEAMKIMTDAKKLLEQTGLTVSLITRCPNGSRWPVLMLEAGETFSDIEKVRNGGR